MINLAYRSIVVALCILCWGEAYAHEVRPAIAEVTFSNDKITLVLTINAEALLSGIGPQHRDTNEAPQAQQYNDLRKGPVAAVEARVTGFMPRLQAAIDLQVDKQKVSLVPISVQTEPMDDLARARRTVVQLSGVLPAGARLATWRYDPKFGDSVVKFSFHDRHKSEWLPAGNASSPFGLIDEQIKSSRSQVISQYAQLGFTHILPKGLDHILFVLGLFLLSVRFKPLLWQVTSFTLAHTLTLGLSIYGVVSLSPAIVEPLIAASIVYVAVENICTQRLQPWRVFVVFGFGLLHGLGFAGVLTEIGLPRNEFLTALIAFNVGVELGQLSVIGLAFAAVGYWAWSRGWYRARVVIPASALIAAVGLYWAVDRIWVR